MSLVEKNKIYEALKKLNEWEFKKNAISRSFKFSTYMDGINYVHSLALLAEEQNHHPDISIGWCSVKIEFTSHDLGGVTENCIKMATLATNLFKE
tara:strand:- start:118 stop:402 length:285 start_codon:yes stop_codon:yes gene_type:complete